MDLSRADSVRLDEIVPSLPLLPPREDHGPCDVLLLLLHRDPSLGLHLRGWNTDVGLDLRSASHHHPKGD